MAFFLPLLLFSLFRNISCSSGTLEAKKNLMENLPLGWKHLTCSLLLLQQSQSYRFGFAPASPVQSFPSPSNPIMHTRKQFSCLQNWSGTGNNKSPTPDTCWQADCCGSKISELQTKPNWKDCKERFPVLSLRKERRRTGATYFRRETQGNKEFPLSYNSVF